MPQYGIDDMGDIFKADKEVFVHNFGNDDHAQVSVSSYGDHNTLEFQDAVDASTNFNVHIPYDFRELTSAYIIVISLCTGGTVVRWSAQGSFGGCDELHNTVTNAIAASNSTLAANTLECLDLSDAFIDVAAGDNVGITFTRVGSHIDDTLGATLHLVSFVLRYD